METLARTWAMKEITKQRLEATIRYKWNGVATLTVFNKGECLVASSVSSELDLLANPLKVQRGGWKCHLSKKKTKKIPIWPSH